MGGAVPVVGGDGGADIDKLLTEFPVLLRTEDGRVKCSLTGHMMQSKVEAVRPYVNGKRFKQASLKATAMEGLKLFEPHIVKSQFVENKLFCRITGRYLPANEKAVENHCMGKRFERGVDVMTLRREKGGEKKVLLVERDPAEVMAEKWAEEATQTSKAETKRSAIRNDVKAVGSNKKTEAKNVSAKTDLSPDPKETSAAERLRLNGGFSAELGCWVPPAHILESDSDEEEDEEVIEEDSDEDDDDDDESASESEFDSDVPVVCVPNFAKIAARANAKRNPDAGLKKGKKTNAKPAKRAKV